MQYGCIFHPPKHNRALCNSLKNLKTIKGPYSGNGTKYLYVVESWYNYPYTYTCGNIINNNDERTHFFRKIFYSQKGWCWICAQLGVTEGRKPSISSWFSLPRTASRTPTNWPQLTQAVCGTWLYNCLTTTCFNPSTGQGDTPKSSTGCTCFLIDGWVEGQYVTLLVTWPQ